MGKCPLCLNTESVYNALLADLRELQESMMKDSSEPGTEPALRAHARYLEVLINRHTGKKHE